MITASTPWSQKPYRSGGMASSNGQTLMTTVGRTLENAYAYCG